MRPTYATRGLALVKGPSVRQLVSRRRAITAAGILALALGNAAIGALAHPRGEPLGRPHTGPFSYLSE
jgi:hypothetical protein